MIGNAISLGRSLYLLYFGAAVAGPAASMTIFGGKIVYGISEYLKSKLPEKEEEKLQSILQKIDKILTNYQTIWNKIFERFKRLNEYRSTDGFVTNLKSCLLYTSPSPRDATLSRMPSSA